MDCERSGALQQSGKRMLLGTAKPSFEIRHLIEPSAGVEVHTSSLVHWLA